jgi:hypothetical protein
MAVSKKVFIIDGGAGRVICAIPALIKHARMFPDEDWSVLVFGFDNLFWGIPELQDRTYSPDTKGIFDNIVMKADQIVTPEPYRYVPYLRKEVSLAEAFDADINGTTDHSDLLPPKLVFNKNEKMVAVNTISDVRALQKKAKTIIFQPFGRGAKINERKQIYDEESRSLSPAAYLNLVKRLSVKYNTVFFGEPEFQIEQDTSSKYTTDLRQWSALIAEADYFVGVDSVGQHIARAVDTPGTIIFGSTYPINTSYPNYFQIIEKPGVKKFAPIRIAGLDSMLANRLNEGLMDFTESDITNIYSKIVADIDKKVKK